jgi:multidrug resistance efflux pump
VIAVVSLLEAGALAGNYFLNTSHYVSTDNAQVDGDKVDINAPMTGTLTRWTVTKGSQVTKQEIVGRIRIQGSGAQPQRAIRSPGHGTIAVNHAVNGQYVTAGTEMATAYDLNRIFVTARVDETEIRNVQVGQQVDISVDAFPHVPFTGLVEDVQDSSAGEFSIFPGLDTDPTNPQKVTQYIPVKVEFTNTGGVVLAPGMNVTVHIHKY